MTELDRRTFLARSSLLAAAAGTAAAIPGGFAALAGDAPEADAAASEAAATEADAATLAAADTGEPLIAHVRNLSTGEIGIFNGTKELVIKNPGLARSILRAAR